MRTKKNREVNIFSASVVDLFASGLGVFLIVAIIALANQKKHNSPTSETEKPKVGESELIGKIESLSSELKKKSDEIINLKFAAMQDKQAINKKVKSKDETLSIEVLKAKMQTMETKYLIEKSELKKQMENKDTIIDDLEIALKKQKEMTKDSIKGEGSGVKYNDYAVGSRIRLENVHFYPGTGNAIEPYASREIQEFAVFMINNPQIMVEVSGHIFETKSSIEAGKAEDVYNLSGERAKFVCKKLVEFGVKNKRLSCMGYGATRPIILTEDQYSQEAQSNRRVEIEILSK